MTHLFARALRETPPMIYGQSSCCSNSMDQPYIEAATSIARAPEIDRALPLDIVSDVPKIQMKPVPSSDQDVTLTLTRLSEPDDMLREVMHALTHQAGIRGELLLIEQNVCSDITEEEFTNEHWTCRIIRRKMAGLSAARNLALREAQNDHVLFCDADAVASAGWAQSMHKGLSRDNVAIVGSRILPRWSRHRPLLAASQVVRDQFSLYDLGEDIISVPRVVGAGFGLNRKMHADQMYFDEALGRRSGSLLGGEESDLCTRVSREGGGILYVGPAIVEHIIQEERHSVRWIYKRLFYAGLGRSLAGGAPSPSRQPGVADWLLLPVILPPYALGWVWGRWFWHR